MIPALALILAAAFPVMPHAKTAGPIHLTFSIPSASVTANDVTPGGATYWIGENWVSSSKVILSWNIATDTDADGAVTFTQKQGLSNDSLFAVVDSAGQTGIASPGNTLVRRDDPSVDANQLHIGLPGVLGDLIVVMWVRPGTGTWFIQAGDNDSRDDNPQFGALTLAPSDFEAYDESSPLPPAAFQDGDIITVLYPFEQGPVHTYSLLQIGAAPASTEPIPTLSNLLLMALGAMLAIVGMLRVAR